MPQFEYRDTWAGWVPIRLEPFRTRRKGESCRRYRWRSKNGLYYSIPLSDEARALAYARRHPFIRESAP